MRIQMCILQIFTAPYSRLQHTSVCVRQPIKALASCSNLIKVSFRLKYDPLAPPPLVFHTQLKDSPEFITSKQDAGIFPCYKNRFV